MGRINLNSIDVYIDRDEINPIYDDLVRRASQNAEDFPFATKKDLFMLSACVGAQQNRYKELIGKTIQIFSGETFKSDTDVPVLAALAYHRAKTIDVLFEPKQIISIAQGWANGGFHIVYQQLITGQANRPLYNLIDMVASLSPTVEDNE